MQKNDILPDEKGIKVVDNFKDFFAENFDQETNVILFRRNLSIDFNAAAKALNKIAATKKAPNDMFPDYIKEFSERELMDAREELPENVRANVDLILEDMRALRRHNEELIDIKLRVIAPNAQGIETTFHMDGGDPSIGHVLCAYNTPSTEGLSIKDVCIEEGDPNGNDPHQDGYNIKKKPGAVPFSFKVGDMWRHATMENDARTQPFVHRAPLRNKQPRLLLTAGG